MKQKFFALCFLTATFYVAKPQTVPSSQKIVKPKTFTLKLQTVRKITNGYLSGINDSLLQLSTKRVTFSNSFIENSDYKTYTYTEVEKVNIRKCWKRNWIWGFDWWRSWGNIWTCYI